MALNLPSLPNVLPSRVRHAATALGGYIGEGAHDVAHPLAHPLEQTWAAFQKYDPNDAAVIRSLYPDSPSNLFNLATILVPGAKGGRAGAMPFARGTPAQASLLKAIFNSSRLRPDQRIGRNTALFMKNDPSSTALATLIGEPVGQRAALGGNLPLPGETSIPFYRADNPLRYMARSGALGPFEAGKVGPSQILYDQGGKRLSHIPSGMDVPPLPGELGNYFPAEPQAAAAQHLFDILMGRNPQN